MWTNVGENDKNSDFWQSVFRSFNLRNATVSSIHRSTRRALDNARTLKEANGFIGSNFRRKKANTFLNMTAIYKARTSARVIEKALHLRYSTWSAKQRNTHTYISRETSRLVWPFPRGKGSRFRYLQRAYSSREIYFRGKHTVTFVLLLFLKTFRDTLPSANGR